MDFWGASWGAIDERRLKEYITRKEEPDEMIECLLREKAKTVCDAGCGCGVYMLRLLQHGFDMSGFDVASGAVEIAERFIQGAGKSAKLKTASVLQTGYRENEFDAVISRDVLDHMRKADAKRAVRELYRITKPGGILLFTLDGMDEEYEREPHCVTEEGDYLFESGKWEGMVFHPYRREEVPEIIEVKAAVQTRELSDGLLVLLKKESAE